MLRLTDIKKDYKVASEYVHALKGVSLDFRASEFVCILGQSGCGKTTLLNIIGGLDHYTSGDLVIQGKSTKDFSDRDWDVYRNHRIGFIFQSYNLIPHQTVLGNVEIALTIAGVSREERKKRATEALERVGLGEHLNKKPNQLSGGQCQRVAIARALVNNPDILLADEPTGALDSETSVQIMELIKEIAAERLVIMVTHNPELAELYASRIVRLKDGLVEEDTNPYTEEEQPAEAEQPAEPVEEEAAEEAPEKKKKEKKPRAKMNFLSSLALSARNLLTKKGRTIITSIAGSIGIISVCLVLALSNGFNHYIKRTEEDMLSYYPVQVSETAYDMASVMMSFTSERDVPDMSKISDKVYVDSFLTGLANGMAITNNISDTYLDYIQHMNPEYYAEIQYSYGVGLVDNLYTSVRTGDVTVTDDNGNQTYVEPSDKIMSLSSLKSFYISELNNYAKKYSNLVPYANFFGDIVAKMPGTSDFNDENYAKFVLSQYDVLGENARFPQNENEAVMVISANGAATDLTLAQLGLLEESKFLSLFDADNEADGTKKHEPMFIDYSEILGKEYTLFFNDAVYSPNEDYVKPTLMNPTNDYPFYYHGTRTESEGITAKDGEGINLKITAVLRLKDGLTYGCLNNGLNITEAAVNHYIEENYESDIVNWVKNDSYFNINLPGMASPMMVYLCPAASLDSSYATIAELLSYIGAEDSENMIPQALADLKVTNVSALSSVIRYLGGNKTVNSIRFYANDFDGKDGMLEYLDAWNTLCETGGSYNGVTLTISDKITYTDTVGLLMGMMQTMLNVITYVLVAFTAISLVVSSVMIGIITYVSVVERVKEIGVLRSLGARKQDIRNLFNAETFIIGLAAGVFGVIVTYLLSFVINAILLSLTGIAGIAALSPLTALIMVCVSVLLTLISGLIPAQAAAKKDPVIALRTE
ncbi:MAG: ABC transporter ATP-binding protein/permease [Clostridia bacterium]|nr:ABC transporter ATP-binding protein/permease [Clostridia bacterium]